VKFDMKSPCDNCPFRNDGKGIALHPERALEISDDVLHGNGSFTCHKTTVYDEELDELVAGPDAQMCAGAMLLAVHEDAHGQMLRIARRLGMWNPERMDLSASVFESGDEMVDWHSLEWDELHAGKRASVLEDEG